MGKYRLARSPFPRQHTLDPPPELLQKKSEVRKLKKAGIQISMSCRRVRHAANEFRVFFENATRFQHGIVRIHQVFHGFERNYNVEIITRKRQRLIAGVQAQSRYSLCTAFLYPRSRGVYSANFVGILKQGEQLAVAASDFEDALSMAVGEKSVGSPPETVFRVTAGRVVISMFFSNNVFRAHAALKATSYQFTAQDDLCGSLFTNSRCPTAIPGTVRIGSILPNHSIFESRSRKRNMIFIFRKLREAYSQHNDKSEVLEGGP